jgi:caa(3)-type oxidase subunit IV
MSTTASTADHGAHGEHHGDHGEHIHPQKYYTQTWAILCGLLIVSFLGPMLGHPLVTLLTAFGIAIVKAYLVCARFMHLNIEKRYAGMLLLTVLALIALFYSAVAPDVMKHEGQHWENVAAKAETQRRLASEDDHGHPKQPGTAGGHAAPGEHH